MPNLRFNLKLKGDFRNGSHTKSGEAVIVPFWSAGNLTSAITHFNETGIKMSGIEFISPEKPYTCLTYTDDIETFRALANEVSGAIEVANDFHAAHLSQGPIYKVVTKLQAADLHRLSSSRAVLAARPLNDPCQSRIEEIIIKRAGPR